MLQLPFFVGLVTAVLALVFAGAQLFLSESGRGAPPPPDSAFRWGDERNASASSPASHPGFRWAPPAPDLEDERPTDHPSGFRWRHSA